jgi:hypothetical protein
MLTILALYHSYSGDDGSFALQYFDKAKALAAMLLARRTLSLQYGKSDPRFGIPGGDIDALYSSSTPYDEASAATHWYSSAAELYRACTEIGAVWTEIGAKMKRVDVAAHGAELLKLAPEIYQQLHLSLNKTVSNAGNDRCWPMTAATPHSPAPPPEPMPVSSHHATKGNLHRPPPTPVRTSFRGYAELLYSGALTTQQVSDIYSGASGTACGNRTLILGSPAVYGVSLSSPTSYGLAFGLLQHDMVEQFLLHYFAMSAHSYARGAWTTPEFSNVVDRDVPAGTYVAAGEVIAPTYLKWMLCFEEPETQTLWLAKATPRDWLVAGEAAVVASNLTTRYGRVSYTMGVAASSAASARRGGGNSSARGAYAVHASLMVPVTFATAKTAPAGGVRIRVRAPVEHAGKLSQVTVGGKAWASFNAAEETIDIAANRLTADLITNGLPHIVVTFA